MKDYWKMSEAFTESARNGNDLVCGDIFVAKFVDKVECEYAAHAINSHDELVEMNKELLAALEAAVECGMVPTSSATEGGAMKYVRQAHVADHIRAAISKANGEQQSQPNALRDDVYVAGGKA